MSKINIKFRGTNYKINKNMTLEDFLKIINHNYKNAVIGVIDNSIKELNTPLIKDCTVDYFDLTNNNGQKVYKRSLSFLFIKATKDVLQEAKVELCHTLSKGQYCLIHNTNRFNDEMLVKIKNRMIELVKENLPFVKTKLNRKEAISLFKKTNRYEKIKLLENIDKETVNIYNLDGYKDYFYGYLVPSTGYLKLFDIKRENEGVVLLLPDKNNPDILKEYKQQPKLLSVFTETKNWAKIMNINLVGDLNEQISKGKYGEIIRTVEALQETKISKIAEQIAKDREKKIVLIAGPSSSGKTSFSKRLEIQLKVNGISSIPISMDDYFVNRDKTPLNKEGNYDFESIYALDLELFNNHIKQLLNGEEVEIPSYNFQTGKREYNGHKVKLKENEILIFEGIHGLNPLLTSSIEDKSKFKIYVSPLTQLNLDYHNRISTTDCRLIRRIVRDNKFRGYSAEKTIEMWSNVRRGEENNIFPYQEEADAIFNSTLIYEISILKKYVEPLLKNVDKNSPSHIEAHRLLNFIQYFKSIDDELDIPPTSIIKEFIGGSRIVD